MGYTFLTVSRLIKIMFNLRFAHFCGTGSDKKRPFGSPVLLVFLTSLIAGFGEARHTMRQQHTVSEKSVSFI